ncbi:50S ribosomal protein L3 N(5)-glutamine methyltransferase [Aestuariibacter halophilus]|uniref:Ribosomal protein uL3 glutamine methyltransferase n=1 Tax=Fluctibacter halophilus TaxID=226011 RepID=A0ABS8G8F5_9ALTE|nr:50S ribosomal protein L3 N(5)-glutamine methyltransferase [Aestuariibacter halophilus]MCC2616744.1 50S ribosomal protein L3 N(5)-glutamine methyltransferase [Aestuariibacter halophilus]
MSTQDPIASPDVKALSTVLDMVRWCVSQFNRADLYFGHGTDNPWDEALALVFNAVHLSHDVYLKAGDILLQSNLTAEEKVAVLALLQQRITTRKPLAYLTHEAWFCGLPFYVDERVLVPRSPFAELISNGFAPFVETSPSSILDMCTGSGCIAIALAYQYPDATVDAVDISSEALQVAEINIAEHDLVHRVYPLQSDLFSQLAGQQYDLIVSNPPYVDAEDMADLPDEFHHEPELGLAAGEDGLDLIEGLLRGALTHLTDNGWLFVEVGNSMVAMDDKFAGLGLTWLDFEHGGHGVFAVSKGQLADYFNG